MPGRRERAQLAVARVEPQPDALTCDLEVLDAPVRRERVAQLVVADARDDEVLILRLPPEQLVAHGAARRGTRRGRASGRTP